MTHVELLRAVNDGKAPALIFLYGTEAYLRDRCLEALRNALVPTHARDFNLTVCYGKETAVEAILDTARTFPVFSSHRLVIIKDAHLLSASQLEAFLPYLQDAVPETVLVFVGDKIDARKKFFQEFKKRGELVEFKPLYDNQIPAFVKNHARAADKTFTEEGLALFCRRVGSSLQEIDAELNKLYGYVGEGRLIDVAEVKAVVSDTRVDTVFDLSNALGKRETGAALRFMRRLHEDDAASLGILAMLTRHFRNLWKISELLDQKVPRRDIPRLVGVNPYFADGLISQSSHFSSGQYRRIFELFLQTDVALKSSGAHAEALMEDLVLQVIGA